MIRCCASIMTEIFGERRIVVLARNIGDPRFADCEVPRPRREVMAGGGRFRRDTPDLRAHIDAGLRVRVAVRKDAGEKIDVGRRPERGDRGAVDASLKSADATEERRRLGIDDAENVADFLAFDFDARRCLGEFGIADRLQMSEGHVGQIEQVIDHKEVVCLDVIVIEMGVPISIIEPRPIRQQQVIGFRLITDPGPDPAVTLDRPIRFDRQFGGYLRLSRNANAPSVGRKLNPVVRALDQVAKQHAFGQRREAVRTGIVEGDDAASLAPVHDQRLVQDLAAKRFPADLGTRRDHVPAILNVHGSLPYIVPVRGRTRESHGSSRKGIVGLPG